MNLENDSVPFSDELIRIWLVEHLAAELGLESEEIDIQEPFESFGLSSREAVILAGDLEDWLGRRLSPTLLWEKPSIEKLAHFLAGESHLSGEEHLKSVTGLPTDEPIAIIGIGCRFPGAEGPEKFWQLLRNGVNAISEVPSDRWDRESYYDPDSTSPGKMNTIWGGFLGRIDLFDARFFGISPREAARMDPQQRLLLETTWDALEDAGQAPGQLRGGMTGVFIGISSNDYSQFQFSDVSLIDAYAGTGNAHSIAANRISYVLDLRGPSLAVDTACSSSLVAVHMACQSLRNGECELALSGGVNIILNPALTINFTQAGVMAPDGQSKAFDSRADGYVRGEGAGIVVLKRLSKAVIDGDLIYAVIRGSAVNHDGRSNGLMAPNPMAQEAVIRDACYRAGVSPSQIQYVEAHGTGTYLGDPIEAKALGKVLSENRSADAPCLIGSVKTNIGHLEAAAGIAGLIKIALCLKHREIPPSLNFQEPNPLIPFEELKLSVQKELSAWPNSGGPLLAGLSSFGFGGTNAHALLEEAPPLQAPDARVSLKNNRDDQASYPQAYLLPLSAQSERALEAQVEAYREILVDHQANPGPLLRDICYTASTRRDHYNHRLAFIAGTRQELVESLELYCKSRTLADGQTGSERFEQQAKIVFVFSGQGSQWLGMGRELLEHEPVFKDILGNCDRVFFKTFGWSLLEELNTTQENSHLDKIDYIQPAIFAIQVSLAALWRSWGIEPQAVLGHSMGEAAAAYIAEAITIEDAVRIIGNRSRLMKRTSGQGAMLATGLSMKEAQDLVRDYEGGVFIAVSNSPSSTILSGDPEALKGIAARLDQQNVFCRMVNVDVAAHSIQMEPLMPELALSLEGLQPKLAQMPIYSTVTGGQIRPSELDVDYWVRNLREPVNFTSAVESLIEDGFNVFLEISPHPILTSAIRQGLGHLGKEGVVLQSMHRDESESKAMLRSLGVLYVLGHPVDWHRLYPSGGRFVRLPGYPWQRQRFWLDVALNNRSGNSDIHAKNCDATRSASAILNDSLYVLDWQPKEVQFSDQSSHENSRWVIFSDRSGVGQALKTLLEAQGKAVFIIYAGEDYGQSDRRDFQIRPGWKEDMQRLFDTINEIDDAPAQRLVHLWCLDAPALETSNVSQIEATQLLGCGSALRLIQELCRPDRKQLSRVWLVTQGAYLIHTDGQNGDQISPSFLQAPLWGLGRSMALEHPEKWGGIIDLGHYDPERAAQLLWNEVRAVDGEDQVAYRKDQRYVLRLARVVSSVHSNTPTQFRHDGSYLITGGLGDLGLEIARWMVARGARRLILINRRQLPSRATWSQIEKNNPHAHQIAAIRDLENLGASVHWASVDVANEAQLSAFLDGYQREGWPPIRGVFHLAGVVRLEPLCDLDLSGLNAVMRPKVTGTWLLHKLLDDAPLDFFTMFSSASSILNSPFLSSYAAANSFLDAMAHYLRGMGKPAISINWGYWSEVGMSARYQQDFGRELIPKGMRALKPDQGLEILGNLLEQDLTQAGVMSIDWHEWSQYHPEASKKPILSNLVDDKPVFVSVDERPFAIQSGATPQESSHHPEGLPHAGGTDEHIRFKGHLMRLPRGERLLQMEKYLRQKTAQVLCLDPQTIHTAQDLTSLGLDSLMVMELIRKYEKDLDLRLYPREIFEHPNISSLSNYLLDELEKNYEGAQSNLVFEPEPGSPNDPFSLLAASSIELPETIRKRNPSSVFLLSAPRSGSTLLRVMLAGHSSLFAPPELHLLPYNTMQERQEDLERTYLEEGLQRAFMELMNLDAEGGKRLVDDLLKNNLPVQEVYRKLQELAEPRILVDKSPSYAANIQTLERAERIFDGAKYIHLSRHPYAMIESAVRIRLEKLFGASDLDPYLFSEQVWATTNNNILEFFKHVDPDRQLHIHFEDLVQSPEVALRRLSDFLRIPFDEALLNPYEGERMTQGIYSISMSVGDPNFQKHEKIDPALGNIWQETILPRNLDGFTQSVAERLKYELPKEKHRHLPANLDPALVPMQAKGSQMPFFCVHPASGLVYFYYDLAQLLDPNQPFYALQDPSLISEQEPFGHIEDFAANYLNSIREVQPEGPYFLGGWSFGGHVAFEMARQLTEQGQKVALVVLMDTEAPPAYRRLSFKQKLNYSKNKVIEYISFLGDVMPYVRDVLFLLVQAAIRKDAKQNVKMSPSEYLQWAVSAIMYRRLERRAGIAESLTRDTRLLHMRLPTARRIFYVLRKHMGVIPKYKPEKYPGKVTLLRCSEQVIRQFFTDSTLGWQDLAVDGVDVHEVPSNHATFLQKPQIEEVAKTLQACITKARIEYIGE